MLVVAVVATSLVGEASSPIEAAPSSNNTRKLLDAVTVAGVMRHETAFQAIADAHGGTRASGTPGYTPSAQYVSDQLTAAGYSPTRNWLLRATPPGSA